MNTTTHQTSRRNRAAYGVLELLKHLTVIVLSVLSVISAYAQTDFESAADAVANMKIGWNLGNSLDSHRTDITDVTTTETLRGQPKTREELMAMMRLAGFNAIRVPVTWYPHLDSSGNIDAAWLNRVQEVVDYVIGQGMYCIINVHHDTGNTDASGATNKGWLKADPDNYTQNHELFEKIWRQVATRFRDYGQLLIFEGFNEMLDIYDSRNYATFKGTNAYEPAVAINAYNSINNYNTAFVNTVRATGGNNTNRNLIIKTYGACEGRGDWSSHLIEPLTSLQLPEQAGHIIVGVHTYPPIINKETKDGITTITNRSLADIQANINIMFNNINTHIAQRLGTPVIIGEWGTSEVDATETDYDLRRGHMLNFVDIFVQLAKQNNITAFYWMGLSDKAARSLPVFNQADLATRMLKAYYGSDYQPTLLSENDYSYSAGYHVEFTKQYAEIKLAESSSNLANTYSQIQIISSSKNNYANPKIWLRVYNNSETNKNVYTITSNENTYNLSTLAAQVSGYIKRITLVIRETGTNSLDIEHVYLIKANGEKTECTPTNRNACSISPCPSFALVEVDESKYNTLYYGTKNLKVPAGVTASVLSHENGTLISAGNYPAGHTIPKATGVLIHAQQSGLYKFDHTSKTGTQPTNNRLRGSDTDKLANESGLKYKLSYGANNDQPIGFYYENSFTSPAHRAYLNIPNSEWSTNSLLLGYAIFDSLQINAVNFPDANLRNYLSSGYTYTSGSTTVTPGNDNLLTPAELANIKTLNVSGKSIESLEGVKHLTALTSLNLSNNNVTTLDLSANKRLKTLNCANNNLTDLDLSANTNLTSLNYAGQTRNITAETAQTIVGYDTRNHPIYHKIYYLRLDDNTTGTGEHTIFQRLTAGNYGNAETSFTPERVLSWTGGEVINGTRHNAPAAISEIDPKLVYGDILLLTDATESGSEASGSVSYTYNVQNSFDTNGTRGNFTLNWVADATEGVVTRVDDITESAVVSTTYVDPLGRTSTRPFSGLNIVITRYSNGFTDQHKQLFP